MWNLTAVIKVSYLCHTITPHKTCKHIGISVRNKLNYILFNRELKISGITLAVIRGGKNGKVRSHVSEHFINLQDKISMSTVKSCIIIQPIWTEPSLCRGRIVRIAEGLHFITHRAFILLWSVCCNISE